MFSIIGFLEDHSFFSVITHIDYLKNKLLTEDLTTFDWVFNFFFVYFTYFIYN